MPILARLFACLLALACLSAAATAVSAEEIRTDDFVLTVPDGWIKANEGQADGAVVALLREEASKCMVSVTITPLPLSAENLAEQAVHNMAGKGFVLTGPEKKGDDWFLGFVQKRSGLCGEHHFSSNGSKGCVLSVFAPKAELLDHARSVLRNSLRPVDQTLFPAAFRTN